MQPSLASLHLLRHNKAAQAAMVLKAARLFSPVYEMFNEKLESIGEIKNPVRPGLTGLGQGTVYLERPMPTLRAGARIDS